MKKTYIIPVLCITNVSVENMVAASIVSTTVEGLGVGGNSSDANITSGNVKGNEGYDVWDDDWSR